MHERKHTFREHSEEPATGVGAVRSGYQIAITGDVSTKTIKAVRKKLGLSGNAFQKKVNNIDIELFKARAERLFSQSDGFLVCIDTDDEHRPDMAFDFYMVDIHDKQLPRIFIYQGNKNSKKLEEFKNHVTKFQKKHGTPPYIIGIYNLSEPRDAEALTIESIAKLIDEYHQKRIAKKQEAPETPSPIYTGESNNPPSFWQRNKFAAGLAAVGLAIGVGIGLALSFTGVLSGIGIPLTIIAAAALAGAVGCRIGQSVDGIRNSGSVRTEKGMKNAGTTSTSQTNKGLGVSRYSPPPSTPVVTGQLTQGSNLYGSKTTEEQDSPPTFRPDSRKPDQT